MPLANSCVVCFAPCTGPRCEKHQLRRPPDTRASRQARGYDRNHDRARRQLAKTLPAPCGYGCGTVLQSGDRWVAAHVVDGQPEFGWMVGCGPCNERAKHSARNF